MEAEHRGAGPAKGGPAARGRRGGKEDDETRSVAHTLYPHDLNHHGLVDGHFHNLLISSIKKLTLALQAETNRLYTIARRIPAFGIITS